MFKAVVTYDGLVLVATLSYRSHSETNAIFAGDIKVWLMGRLYNMVPKLGLAFNIALIAR